MSFVKRFQIALESLHLPPENASYVVAYSGGIDSHVLLFCCQQLNLPVRAIHVHHGLQNVADDWVTHCQHICQTLKISLDVVYVNAKKKKGQSPEETARRVRYLALQSNLNKGDCLLTAQHLNDQAETLLLQLFRTASTAGLSAMPAQKWLAKNTQLRPLLSFSRKEIEAFAEENKLNWVEDPSNQDVSYDRNFIRKNVVPLLKGRWPKITEQLSTVARLQANNLQVLEDMAAIDLANLITVPVYQKSRAFYKTISVLSITQLKELSLARQLNVLRYWIIKADNNSSTKTSPTRNLLEEIDNSLINSMQDANPVIKFSGFEIRKFKNGLYLLKAKGEIAGSDLEKKMIWKPQSSVIIPVLNIQIKSSDSVGEGLSRHLLNESLTIAFRKGGEHFHPVGRQHSQSLKKLLQEANVPPWERNLIPLLYFNDELVAVLGLWVSQQFAVGEGENGWLAMIGEGQN